MPRPNATRANEQNFYELIGLSQDAPQALIEERCIKLGEQCRPEKNLGEIRAAIMFAQIDKAYETLGDPVRRAAYDSELLWQSSKPSEIKSTSRLVVVAISMLVILPILGYAFAYRPYIAQREEAARIATEEARMAAEKTAKKAAEEKARVLEARLAEDRARIMEAQSRAAEDRARQTANRADAEDLARVENLRAQCNAAGAGANRGGNNAAGNFMAAQLAIPICTQSERAVKDRLRYEALRSQDPVAATKELEAQRVAREERQRNRPVVTNCNQWAPGYATCISR